MSAPTSRLESLASLRTATTDVAFATAFGTLMGGSFMVGFIQLLGGNDLHIGLIAALPALAGLMQIPGAAFGRAQPNFKKFVGIGGGLWRLLQFPIIALALLVTLPDQLRLYGVLVCITLASLATQFVGPIYNEWIANLVPDQSRGWYFSQRTLVSSLVGMLFGLAGARLLDQFKNTPQEAQGFALIFTIGCICGAISWFFFIKMSDLPRPEVVKASVASMVDIVREPFQDKNFRRVMAFVAVFWVGAGFVGNLFSAFALETLGMSFTVLQFTSVTHTLGTILMVKTWGFLTDRYGNKPILILVLTGVTFTPIMWIVCQPGQDTWNAAVLIIGHIFPGIFWSGIGVATMNLYLATSPKEKRASYLASALTVQAIVSFVAPLAGSTLMTVLRPLMDTAQAYRWVFVGAIVGRGAAVLMLLAVKEQGSATLSKTVKTLTRVSPKGVAALRQLRSGDEQARVTAIGQVASSNFTLATDELAQALSDPSPRIRREAALAMSRMASEETSIALIEFIESHPNLVEEETLEALGSIPSPNNARVLVRYLKDPSPMLRRAAAKALGRVSDPNAIEALAEAARQPGDLDLRRAAIQALRQTYATDPELYRDALFDSHPSVRIAAAEAVSELNIKDLADSLRHSLHWFPDEAASEIAYALGTVGRPEDIESIIHCANEAIGVSKRRRCLLAAAKLLGVEQDLYKLLIMDSTARDNAILQKVRPLIKKDPILKTAVEAFSTGDENHAVSTLVSTPRLYALKQLVDTPIEEAFLLASIAYLQKNDEKN